MTEPAGIEAEVLPESEVLVERRGGLGLLVLNRPRAVNALTLGMVRLLAEALDAWEHDATVQNVAIVGAGERGLCAGGDIVGLYRAAEAGDPTAPAEFWSEEYRLDLRIARYPKPIVAVQDGIVLGGGIGVSSHAAFAIVTERSRLGLPETGIGFIPDVGGTWLLSRAPGRLGLALALAARSVGAADAIHVGLSAHHVASDLIPELLDALEREPAAAVVERLSTDPGPSALAASRPWIDAAFAEPTVPGILSALRAGGEPEAAVLADEIAAKSPLAVAVTLEAVRRAGELPDLAAVLEQEFRVSMHAVGSHDFAEGVRAMVIDKDRAPHWVPDSHDAVDLGDVAAYFAPHPAVAFDLGDGSTAAEAEES